MKAQNKLRPHEKRKGWLKNDNPPGDFMKALRCGAKTRKGTPCLCPAMKNGRCRLHGGKSTGPRTPEGIERIRKAHLKHGKYSREAIVVKKAFNELLRELQGTIQEVNHKCEDINLKI